MKLQGINIRNFRGAASVSINFNHTLNVFIGKNNSGKSTILTAIDNLFQVISQGVVALDSSIGKQEDRTRFGNSGPIFVAAFFSIQSSEKVDFIQNLKAEFPQMKNAIDSAPEELWLAIEYCFDAVSNQSFSVISRLGFTQVGYTSFENEVLSILRIERASMGELISRARASKNTNNTVMKLDDFIQEMGSRELSFIRERFIEPSPYKRRITAELRSIIEKSFDGAESSSDFKQALALEMDELKASIEFESRKPLNYPVETIAGQVDSVPNSAIYLVNKISEYKVLYIKERRSPIGKQEADRLLQLKVTRGGPQQLEEIRNTVEALLGVQIDAFQSASSSNRYAYGSSSEAELDVDNFLVELNGAGIREALRLVLDYEFVQPNLLLVEEPELHLHPALESSMLRYLKKISRQSQVLMATHSTNFLDLADPQGVFLVTKKFEAGTQVERLEDYDEMAEVIPAEIGLRLASLFMYERLILVEGPSDEAIFREIAAKENINLGLHNVGFLPIGGVGNMRYYAAAKLVDFLSKRRVMVWLVVDRDDRDDESFKWLKEKINAVGKLHILRRRQIENYFLSGETLKKLLEMKVSFSGIGQVIPSANQLDEEIRKAADETQAQVVSEMIKLKLCNPAYPDRIKLDEIQEQDLSTEIRSRIESSKMELDGRISEIEESINNAKELVSLRWEEDWKSMVSGDKILDLVCKRYGLRFHKNKDSERLASSTDGSLVDSELVELVKTFIA